MWSLHKAMGMLLRPRENQSGEARISCKNTLPNLSSCGIAIISQQGALLIVPTQGPRQGEVPPLDVEAKE